MEHSIDTSNGDVKGKKRVLHKWKHEEIDKILDYMVETIQKGLPIEKPTALSYYQTMIEKLEFPQEIRPKPLIDKVSKLRGTFKSACLWEKRTGQGIKDKDGPITFRAVLLLKCKYYDKCSIIWGTRANVNPPYVSSSDTSSQPLESNENVSPRSCADGDQEDETNSYRERSRSNSPIDELAVDLASDFNSQESVNSSESLALSPPRSSSSSYRRAAVNAAGKLGSALKQKPKLTAAAVFQEFATTRHKQSLEKMQFQKQQIKLDEYEFKSKFALKQEKFEFKKNSEVVKIEAEKDMLRMKLASEEKIMELKIKELELQIELARATQ